MLRGGDRCKFIKGLQSQRDSRCYFIATRRLQSEGSGKQLEFVYMNYETVVQQNIYYTPHPPTPTCLSRYGFLLNMSYIILHTTTGKKNFICAQETNSVTHRFPASWNNLAKNPLQLNWIKWHISRFKIPASLTCTLLPSPPPLPFVFFDTCTPISIFQPLRRTEKQPNVCLTKLFFRQDFLSPGEGRRREKKEKKNIQTDSILSSMLTLSFSHNNYQ